MPLRTIDDLLQEKPAEVERLIQEAGQLGALFEEYLVEGDGSAEARAPGLHASEISKCDRQAVYALLGEERRDGHTDVTWKKRFLIGHAVHDMFQSAFEKMTRKKYLHITFEAEVKIAPELQPMAAKWNIQSHCDGVFTVRESWNGPELYRVALEIKTKSPPEYDKLLRPEEVHVEQGHVYMACLDVPLIWFLYYNKGNQNYTNSNNPSFLLKYNPKKWAELETRFTRFYKEAESGVLPVRQEGVHCTFCAFAWTCQPNYNLRKKGGLPIVPSGWSKP